MQEQMKMSMSLRDKLTYPHLELVTEPTWLPSSCSPVRPARKKASALACIATPARYHNKSGVECEESPSPDRENSK